MVIFPEPDALTRRPSGGASPRARCAQPRCLERPLTLSDLTGAQELTLVAASEYHGVMRDHTTPQIVSKGRMTLVLRDPSAGAIQFHVQGLGRSSPSSKFFEVRWVMITCVEATESLRVILEEVLSLPCSQLAQLTALNEPLGDTHKLVYEAERQQLRRLPLGGNLIL